MRTIIYLAGLLLAFFIGFNCRRESTAETITVCDTVVSHDTLIIRQPPVGAQAPLQSRRIVVAADSVEAVADTDSVAVALPAVSRKYEGEGYEAYVSGIDPKLDSLRLYGTTKQITTRFAMPERNSRWSVGVSAGYAATPRGLQPYVGIGVSYRLFSF